MTKTYLFTSDKGRFIINDERSKIGYSYPRIFVECPDKYVNIDVTLGTCFNMKKSDFESWLDGSEVRNTNAVDVCRNIGMNYEALMSVVSGIQTVG